LRNNYLDFGCIMANCIAMISLPTKIPKTKIKISLIFAIKKLKFIYTKYA
tara:strand:- start:16016 stop:16165 length:150 start_codon:yes stop_codon:yes gene_type:complete